jgi:hypothetical protein
MNSFKGEQLIRILGETNDEIEFENKLKERERRFTYLKHQ